MNSCLMPNKSLFVNIESRMKKYEKKLKKLLSEEINEEKIHGGAFVIIPSIIGIVINLFAINNEVANTNNFIGLREKLLNHKGVKPLHIPNNNDYDIDDERRRIQLFDLLTNDELNGKQLQVYNAYSQPRRDQVDIQRCLYILTSSYIEQKYGNRKKNDYNIKDVIYSLFSNHLYLLALISYFIFDDETKETKEKVLFVFKYIYPLIPTFSYENEFADHSKLKKRQVKTNPPTINFIYPVNDEVSNVNEYANNTILRRHLFSNENKYGNDVRLDIIDNHDFIPLPTQSQTRERNRRYDIIPIRTLSQTRTQSHIPPISSNWGQRSHMLWERRDTRGGTIRKKKSRNNKTNKRRITK